MAEETNTFSADGRSALRRWWDRHTYHPVIGGKHFMARGVTVLSPLDRLLVLFGRDVVTVVSTEAELDLRDDGTHKAMDGLTIEVGTQPRRYR